VTTTVLPDKSGMSSSIKPMLLKRTFEALLTISNHINRVSVNSNGSRRLGDTDENVKIGIEKKKVVAGAWAEKPPFYIAVALLLTSFVTISVRSVNPVNDLHALHG
jgi:hypothetical protein